MKLKSLRPNLTALALMMIMASTLATTSAHAKSDSRQTQKVILDDPTLANWRLQPKSKRVQAPGAHKEPTSVGGRDQRIDKNLTWNQVPSIEVQELKTDTKYLVALNASMLAFMNSLPKDIVNWQDDPRSAFEIWESNSRKLPHFDSDTWHYNYVAHPLAGASYYRVCRDKGFSFGQCYFYSFLISTFVWEYGLESTREQPSIQDLIITPTAGALLGEVMTTLSEEIEDNGGEVLGSPAAGKMIQALLNPIGSTIQNIRAIIDPIGESLNADVFVGYGVIKSQRLDPLNQYDQFSRTSWKVGVKFKLPAGWEQKLFR